MQGTTHTDQLLTVSLAELRPNPANPRGEIAPDDVLDLIASVKAQGILQPLLIIPGGTVVAGHRRLLAATLAGLHEAPVIIKDLTLAQQLEAMIAENLQRQDLDPLQEARAYRQLLAAGSTQADICRKVGTHPVRVATRLKILDLAPELHDLFRLDLSPALAPILAKVTDWDKQRRLAAMAVQRRLSALQLEDLVDEGTAVLTVPKASPKGQYGGGGGAPSKRSNPTRTAAVQLLEGQPERSYTTAELTAALKGVCGPCGMAEIPAVCGECPLPRFLVQVASCR